jgi:hypothetical protein
VGALALAVLLSAAAAAQPAGNAAPPRSAGPEADPWAAVRFLVGEWVGEGSGQPGQGTGGFSFRFDLGARILVRRDHSEYPRSHDRPAVVHDALMVVYPQPGRDALAAVYFDNEGHVIRYEVSAAREGTVVLLSEAAGGGPRYRLTYTQLGPTVCGSRSRLRRRADRRRSRRTSRARVAA